MRYQHTASNDHTEYMVIEPTQRTLPVGYSKPLFTIERFAQIVAEFDFDYSNNLECSYERELQTRILNDIMSHVYRFPEYATIYSELVDDDCDMDDAA